MKNLIKNTIIDFLENKATNDETKHPSGIEIYNEYSMQHELGILLREKIAAYNQENGRLFVVQFERNRRDFGINDSNIPKSEIDIVVYEKNQPKETCEKYAIELKFPLYEQGKIPLHMYDFLEDIAFCEALVYNNNSNFNAAFAVTLVNTHKYCGHNDKSILIDKGCDDKVPYKYFRNAHKEKIPQGQTFEYTKGKKIVTFTMKNEYDVEWQDTMHIAAVALKNTNKGKKGISNGKYYIVSI